MLLKRALVQPIDAVVDRTGGRRGILPIIRSARSPYTAAGNFG